MSAGQVLIALEKFSNFYSSLNTFQPLESLTTVNVLSTYPLSSYNDSWGWGLNLPSNFVPDDIDKFYIFFEGNSNIDGEIKGGILDFNNDSMNIEFETNYKNFILNEDSIFDELILSTLYENLSLVE